MFILSLECNFECFAILNTKHPMMDWEIEFNLKINIESNKLTRLTTIESAKGILTSRSLYLKIYP